MSSSTDAVLETHPAIPAPATSPGPEAGLGRADAREATRTAFERLARLAPHDPGRATVREELVRLNLPLVEHLARRFCNRGEPLDDLTQVGTIGLLKAVDRFEPQRGVEFSTYATPTIVGEIKRHFRDRGWSIRVPRRLQEMRLELVSATADLTQHLGRSPTVAELAERLKVDQDTILEGLESANAYSTLSLDAPDTRDDISATVAEVLGIDDDALGHVEYRESLKPLLAGLDPRDRQILLLRFFHGLTQSQIATEMGMSQMHVSRLLSRTLVRLREGLLED
jgi:RNA polymerase sigma-B factor